MHECTHTHTYLIFPCGSPVQLTLCLYHADDWQNGGVYLKYSSKKRDKKRKYFLPLKLLTGQLHPETRFTAVLDIVDTSLMVIKRLEKLINYQNKPPKKGVYSQCVV